MMDMSEPSNGQGTVLKDVFLSNDEAQFGFIE